MISLQLSTALQFLQILITTKCTTQLQWRYYQAFMNYTNIPHFGPVSCINEGKMLQHCEVSQGTALVWYGTTLMPL